jgi:hypothetical protein
MVSTLQIILLVANFIYGIPMLKFRYKYRSTVYRDKRWAINILPYFVKETHSLFTNKYFKTKQEIKFANFYRLYLAGNLALFLALVFSF